MASTIALARSGEPDFETMRLMIVDDHPGVRKLIRQFVASASDTVCECADGDEAIRKAFDFRPDAVTMDMRMPGTCGLTATRALRAVHPAARVVIVTSHDQPGLDRAASDAGAEPEFAHRDRARCSGRTVRECARSRCRDRAANGTACLRAHR